MAIDPATIRAAATAACRTVIQAQYDGSNADTALPMATAMAEAAVEGAVGAVAALSSPDSVSITTLVDSTSALTLRNMFSATSYTTFTENTHWKRNSPDTGIAFDSTNGRITIPDVTAKYRIGVVGIIGGVSSSAMVMSLRRNGSDIIWTGNVYMHSSVDPVERTILGLFALAANDYVEVLVDPASATYFATGCSITVEAQ